MHLYFNGQKVVGIRIRAKKDVQISRIAECTCHKDPCFLLRAKNICGKLN